MNNNAIANLLKYLEDQKNVLIRLKNKLSLQSSFFIDFQELYDIEKIVQSNKKSLDSILAWYDTVKEDKIETLFATKIKLLDNLSLIKSVLRDIFDCILELDISDESLADTILIGSSDISDEEDLVG